MRAAPSLSDFGRAGLFGVAYFTLASLSIASTRFDGGLAQVWIAAAMLNALLMRLDTRAWWPLVSACALASVLATSFFGLGVTAALPMAILNIGESLIGAGLLRLARRRDDYLATLPNVGLFVACAGVVAPFLTAFGAGTVASLVTNQAWYPLARGWFIGHALGMLVFAPPITMFLRNEFGEWLTGLSGWRRLEAVALFAALIGVCVLTFGQERLPLLFLPMLPMIVITFRLDRAGAALAVIGLVVTGGTLTALGHGPITLIPGTVVDHSFFLQVYFAVSVLTVLPAAAELRQRRDIFRRLRDSEARYKLITENASDIVLELDTHGQVRYVSPSVEEITGFTPDQLIGHRPQELLSGPDARTFLAAHRAVREQPGLSTTVEYRAPDAHGAMKWFEARTRGIVGENGELAGSVSLIRDISHRKSLEIKLAHAATTDSLTGLGNRRAFDALLDQRLSDTRADGSPGCVAIFDIDFFKRVNDQHGHAAGDRVLESFAATALGIVRTDDYVARLGGEEFGIIFTGVGLAQAERICDRLRAAIARAAMRTASGQTLSITVSAGLAEITPGISRDAVMRAADAALYRAKAGGRDRLAIAA